MDTSSLAPTGPDRPPERGEESGPMREGEEGETGRDGAGGDEEWQGPRRP